MNAIYQVRGDRAFGYSRTSRSWGSIDVTRPLNLLFAEYHEMEIGLECLGKEYTLVPRYYQAELQNRSDTLQDWLNSIAGVALQHLTNGFPEIVYSSAHYQSLYADKHAQAFMCPRNYHHSQNFVIDDANDMVVVTEDKWFDVYRNNVLYNVNGQWVPHTEYQEGVRLLGGGNIARKSTAANIGCLVFNEIGNVKTFPTKDLTINKVDAELDYYSNLLVTLPESITGKTVGFVIAGIMHWLPISAYISDNVVLLSIPNFSLIKTVLETRQFYDWDDIGVGDLSVATNVTRLRSGETLKAMLEHESSFFFMVDNPYLEQELIGLDHAATYGRFILNDPNDPDSKLPLGPIFNDFGRTVSYWPMWEAGVWTFNTTEFTAENRLFSAAQWYHQNVVNDARPIVGRTSEYLPIKVEMLRIRARKK